MLLKIICTMLVRVLHHNVQHIYMHRTKPSTSCVQPLGVGVTKTLKINVTGVLGFTVTSHYLTQRLMRADQWSPTLTLSHVQAQLAVWPHRS